MLNTQLNTAGEALDLLKRIEIMGTRELYNRRQSQNSVHGNNDSGFESTRYMESRNQDQAQGRWVQYNQNPVSDHYYRRERRNDRQH
jgi:hypothetical protein